MPASGRRATTGLAWAGGIGANSSGDIFLAFATGNHVRQGEAISALRMLSPDHINPLLLAAAEATEEAILNALSTAETMTGFAGHIAYAVPHDRFVEMMPALPSVIEQDKLSEIETHWIRGL